MVSDTFRAPPGGLTGIPHHVVIEQEAALLAAEVIAYLLQPDVDGQHFVRFIDLVRIYYLGKGGDKPAKSNLREADNILKAQVRRSSYAAAGKSAPKRSILNALTEIYAQARNCTLTGDPSLDWRALRCTLESGHCPRFKNIAGDARALRLFQRGVALRQALSADWREHGVYRNALDITRQAFVRDHFSIDTKRENGLVIMNMHKAKGKQFDEVIIFEGWPITRKGKPPVNRDRIVPYNTSTHADDQARQNLRVSATRAKRRTKILTPLNDPCVLLDPGMMGLC